MRARRGFSRLVELNYSISHDLSVCAFNVAQICKQNIMVNKINIIL